MDPTNKQGESDSSTGMKSLWVVLKFLTDVSFSSASKCMSYDFLSQKTKSQPGCLRHSLGTVSTKMEHATGNLQEKHT